MNRRERINELADGLCRGKRLEAADRHLQYIATANKVTKSKSHSSDYHSFLAGWDAAMALRHDELAEENHSLHSIILDLCTRMVIEKCTTCQGEGVLEKEGGGDFKPCPDCEQGWRDKPEK